MSTSRKLLTRDDFRERVFARDGNLCVLCGATAQDAHHILERRLWPDGGYYLDNGASVCGPCHLECESTAVSVEQVRVAARIAKPILPPHLYDDEVYDKWGNIVLPNGTRLRGELAEDASVLKIMGNHAQFSDLVKYPRTYHMPWSLGMNDDDRMVPSMSQFEGERVILSIKMDGENTSMYPNAFHARSVDGRNHPSRNHAKAKWAEFCGDIPEGWRICGENLYAEHSLPYDDLPSYMMAFSVWNRSVCLPWDESLEWFELLGLDHVPVAYDGIYDEAVIKAICLKSDRDKVEGFVLRKAAAFNYGAFRTSVAKYVRKNHVQTAKHWAYGQRIVPNKLAKK
jgi:RNA ligase